MAGRVSPIVKHIGAGAICGVRDGCVTTAVHSNLEQEHRCLRQRAGLLDLNHYAKVKVSGSGAEGLINRVILTDLARLPVNQLQSSFLLAPDGRPIAEVLVANHGGYFLILSEGVEPADLFDRLFLLARETDAIVVDETESLGLLGLEGPYSWELLKSFLGIGIIGTRYLEILEDQSLRNTRFSLYRAGKSGEYGYMLLTSAAEVHTLWDALRSEGERFSALPVGYRTLDLCKLENRFPSQHQEGSKVANVLELNTRVLVSRDKGDYAGCAAIQDVIATELSRRVIGLEFTGSLPADAPSSPDIGSPISCAGAHIGELVSVGYSYALKRWIALALVRTAYAYVGLDYAVGTANGEQQARTVSAPFLFNLSLKIRPQEDSYFALQGS